MTNADCCADAAAGENCPAMASAKPTSQFMNTLCGGAECPVGPRSAELPAETHAEEIGAPEHAKILPGVIEADRKAALAAVVESTTEGQALQVLLIGERGGCRIYRSQIVGGGVAVAPPRRKPEGRAAQTLRHPLATKREPGPVVVGLVEVGDQAQTAVVGRDQIVGQTHPEDRRKTERLRLEGGGLRVRGHRLLPGDLLPLRLHVQGLTAVRQIAPQVGYDEGEPNRVATE